MLKKLIIVYNPRSSRFSAVEREVLMPARKLKGWLVGKYEVKAISLKENVQALAKILDDGDLVIAAGGDGTAAMTMNSVVQSGKDVTLGVLGYGNFNDLARMLKSKQSGDVAEIVKRFEAGKVTEAYPLEVEVDGRHWRYVMAYVSLGLLAESTAVFDKPSVRKRLRTGEKSLFFSILTLAKWYFQNRKREFLPASTQTDYLAVNGTSVARIMRGGNYYQDAKEFRSTWLNLRSFWRLMWFMVRSILVRIPGKETQKDIIILKKQGRVMIQAEGEYEWLDGVKKIEVKKSERAIKVIEF